MRERALRVLPVYLAFLCVLAVLEIFTPFRQTVCVWIGSGTFTTNFVWDGKSASGHLWSLAVEEQFYLLWPSVFVLFGVAKNLWSSLWIVSLPICIAPIARVTSYLKASPAFIRPLFSDFSFLNYFDSLAIGCACAILLARRRNDLRDWTTTRPRLVVLVAFTLIIIPYTLAHWPILGIFTVPLRPTCEGIGIAMILMQSVICPQLGFYPFLNHIVVCQIGVLSYSLYIWQQIFCTDPHVFGLGDVWWMSFPCWLIPVFTVAMISYYGLEQPLFRLRRVFENDDLVRPAKSRTTRFSRHPSRRSFYWECGPFSTTSC